MPNDFDRVRSALRGVDAAAAPGVPGEADGEVVSFPPGHFRGKDPREMGIDLNAIDLRGLDLSGANLEGVAIRPGKRVDGLNLAGANLTEAILPVHGAHVDISGAIAHWTKFSNAELPDLVAVNLDARSSDWYKAHCPRMNATGAQFLMADCREADFSEFFADYRGMTKEEIEASRPNFTGAYLIDTNLSRTRLIFDDGTIQGD